MFHLYGLIVGVAIVVGYSVVEKLEPRVNKVFPVVLLMGILGARLYHVIDLWEYYRDHLAEIPAIWNGGLGIFGGIIGGIIGLRIYQYTNVPKNQRKTDFWQILSAMITGLPLAQAIGRWGNLANNELWGRGHTPLFLYESILDLALFGILWRTRSRAAEVRVAIYLAGYGLIRLLLEPLKVDPWWVGYLLSVVMLGAGAVLWYKSHTAIKNI